MAVFPAIPYCIDLIGGPCLETNAAVVKAFRPGEPSNDVGRKIGSVGPIVGTV